MPECYALIAACQYAGTPKALTATSQDAAAFSQMLQEDLAVPAANITVMDEAGDRPPTAASLRKALSWYCGKAAAGDSLLFYFAGHGTSIQSPNGVKRALVCSDLDLLTRWDLSTIATTAPEGMKFTIIADASNASELLPHPPVNGADTKEPPAEADNAGRKLGPKKYVQMFQAKYPNAGMTLENVMEALRQRFPLEAAVPAGGTGGAPGRSRMRRAGPLGEGIEGRGDDEDEEDGDDEEGRSRRERRRRNDEEGDERRRNRHEREEEGGRRRDSDDEEEEGGRRPGRHGDDDEGGRRPGGHGQAGRRDDEEEEEGGRRPGHHGDDEEGGRRPGGRPECDNDEGRPRPGRRPEGQEEEPEQGGPGRRPGQHPQPSGEEDESAQPPHPAGGQPGFPGFKPPGAEADDDPAAPEGDEEEDPGAEAAPEPTDSAVGERGVLFSASFKKSIVADGAGFTVAFIAAVKQAKQSGEAVTNRAVMNALMAIMESSNPRMIPTLACCEISAEEPFFGC